jgi:transposase-like protein
MWSVMIIGEAICPDCGQDWEVHIERDHTKGRREKSGKQRLKCPTCGRKGAIMIVVGNGAAQPR